ncbi:PD40 domain-containing protein [bacterium]|nr:PD40 domain-containing protein [bacterium]
MNTSRSTIHIITVTAAIGVHLLRPVTLQAQMFGKNKVQYHEFNWEYIQSRHFDIYYYEGGRGLADFTADIAESSYVDISRHFRYRIIKRIPILVYNSHNDFSQTNVTTEMIEESVGGFTEIFKDRVVIPFQGSYEEFRHVIEHELTHAVMFQMLYGQAVGSMVSGMARFQVPLWVAEGLSEYMSRGWDTESDFYMRDATINGYVPPVDQIYGFMAYKGGQSLINYICDTYGKPKLGEFLNKLKMLRDLEEALKQSIGLDIEEFSDRWHKYLRKEYWPDISDRKEPEDIAHRLTDHVEERTFLNNSPSLSPNGDKLVFLSNRSDYIDIFMMNTVGKPEVKRLVRGERSDIFEELHWLRPGIGWSPDATRIVFAAKAGGRDALHIVDVATGEIVATHILDLDGLFAPDWSPDGRTIAFMGIDNGASDLYLFDLETGAVEKLTDDIFSDLEPKWSPDGKEIVFVSDRQDRMQKPDSTFRMQDFPYRRTDIYTIRIADRAITRYTFDDFDQTSPVFSPDGNAIAYASDEHGINNIYILERATGESHPITNLLTGVSQISWSREGSRLAFSSFFNAGYDIYMMSNPWEQKDEIVIEDTEFIKRAKERVDSDESYAAEIKDDPALNEYRNYVFGNSMKRQKERLEKLVDSQFPDTLDYKNSAGEYRVKDYRVQFTPDAVTGGAGYSSYFGIQGSSLLAFSDILGNHRITTYFDVFYSLKNSNFQLSYYYLPKQTDFGVSIFHFSRLLFSYFTFLRDRNYGFSLMASRPFSRYTRLNYSLTGMIIDRDWGQIDPYGFSGQYLHEGGDLFKRQIVQARIGYNTDTVVWGMTGPVNGGRSSYNFSYSPELSEKNSLSFWTVTADWRRYIRLSKDVTLALRTSGGVSGGRQPQRFLLGGMMGWINYRYSQIPEGYWGDDMFYFSSVETPLRGYYYYQMLGTRYMLTNLELRFPLVQYLILGWPLPIGFQNIRGALFFDMGSAWDNDRDWKPFRKDREGRVVMNDLAAGMGVGLRVNLGFFLIKYDIAWRTDFADVGTHPVHYFTLGAEY